VELSEYELRVLTANGRTAYCGGVRLSVDTVGTDSLYTRWLLADHPIPSYLASVAVANYTHVDDSYTTALGETIPVWLTARPQDTTAMKNSFLNLIGCLSGFEEHYGPYRWPRVGFVSVPFNAGAMEHATNIAYPSFAINGNLTFETLIAHELSHHWWGDLVTCRTAEDMWLNEGWASYCEALFEEIIYGVEAYADYVASNHKDVLTDVPNDDGGYFPVSGVPHELTYSGTVYSKGADIVHNLRGVMGDD
ncbi:MAG: M1 family aminopeptidase, partial [Bacteroidota bacterium]